MSFAQLIALLIPAALCAQVAEFRVRETAGLRRFGYPVRARFHCEKPAAALRLLDDGKTVPAQFTPIGDGALEIDFSVSLGPFEVRRYRVEEGPGPAPGAGIDVVEIGEAFQVRYPAGLVFEIPKHVRGFLSLVRWSELTYVGSGSRGFVLRSKDGAESEVGSSRPPLDSRILKRGPLSACLRFEGHESLGQSGTVKTTVEMEFPRSKSWVEVRWTVEDPDALVAAMEADVGLLLDGDPVLVDFGAGTMVYAALRNDSAALFQADLPSTGPPSWRIDVAGGAYAAGQGNVEGWAHVMDRRRATAVAVADFARSRPVTSDAIFVNSRGRLAIRRDFASTGARSLAFWLHFVDMPVHVGAATSPQSMQTPPRVEWE
ncbi:MAG TPA: hypothetical protein VLE22_01510 [Bryobacteraceae bacterium]|nr:hypothetical protein [Bryobacteraceae bacterium]